MTKKGFFFLAGVLIALGVLLIPVTSLADGTAVRTLPDGATPGSQFTVQVDITGATAGAFGGINEVIPAGCTYTGSASSTGVGVINVIEDSGVLNFILGGYTGSDSVSYDLNAPGAPGVCVFSGTVKVVAMGHPENIFPIGGDNELVISEISVEALVINELIPSPTSPAKECIELFNKEATAVDLTGWTIEDLTGPVALDGLNIPANGYLALQQGTDFSFLLNNGGDVVTLKKGATVVDKVAYGDGNDGNVADNAPSVPGGQSVGRWPNGADTDVDNVDFILFEEPTCGAANAITDPNIDAIRTLPAVVNPDEQFQVSVYCMGITPGGVTETLPAGFGYVNGSHSPNIAAVVQNGNDITFGWMAQPGTFTYEVIAPATLGDYIFTGEAKGQGVVSGVEEIVSVTGDDTVSVQDVGTLPNVMFALANYNVNEGNIKVVEVILSQPGTQTITVEYDTVNGTAVAGVTGDYTAQSGILTFAPGDLSETFEVPTIEDFIFEGAEMLTAVLSNPTNANLGAPNPTTITIDDDEVEPAQVWDCPVGPLALIAPYPDRARPELAGTYLTVDIVSDTEWFQILWLENEATQQWQIYDTRQTIGNTLTQLQPDECYYVVVSEPGQLMLY